MARYITKKEAVEIFRNSVMPGVRDAYEQDGKPDWPARREAWNNMTDSMCKNRDITNNQYNTWSQPRLCGD